MHSINRFEEWRAHWQPPAAGHEKVTKTTAQGAPLVQSPAKQAKRCSFGNRSSMDCKATSKDAKS
jgi:hypothetical protein